jgi:hypothetical protein
MDSERGKISTDVGGSAGIGLFSFDMNNRNRSLGGDAGNATIDKLVEHQVADDQHSQFVKTG